MLRSMIYMQVRLNQLTLPRTTHYMILSSQSTRTRKAGSTRQTSPTGHASSEPSLIQNIDLSFTLTMVEGMLIQYRSLVNSFLKWTKNPNKIQYKYKFVNSRHQPTHRISPIHHTTCIVQANQ